MKTIITLIAVVIICVSFSSCTKVVVCSCGVTVTTSTGADTTFNVSSERYRSTLSNKNFCNPVFKDSMQFLYPTDRIDCSVNGVGM